jgi:hypothetical protein
MKARSSPKGCALNHEQPPCICGHGKEQHLFLKRSPGCRVCNCICYRHELIQPADLKRPKLIVELVGIPSGQWKPWEAA